ncbi:MAG: glycerophosphodiester phosphodiesterase [Solirubrobacteraceae bacterium]
MTVSLPRLAAVLAGALSLLLAAPAATLAKKPITKTAKPIVFGHRGAAGYRPEHTLASYELGARMGADYIEPDLVSTKDHVLVCRHEPNITDTTDVANHPEFANRKTTKTIDGVTQTGWFTTDFTYAELKTLHAKERLPAVRQRNTLYDGRYHVPTFQQVIDLSKRLSKELHRPVGIIPETKHPTFFRQAGLPIEPKLVQALNKNHLNTPLSKVVVQSFEVNNLKALNKVLRVPLLQLIDSKGGPADLAAQGVTYDQMSTPAGLRQIATYADWIGPSKDRIVPLNADQTSGTPTSLIRDAHAAGLLVGPFTFRNENQFLPAELRRGDPADPNFPNLYGNAFGEYARFFGLGVDGLFSDNPDTAIAARGH